MVHRTPCYGVGFTTAGPTDEADRCSIGHFSRSPTAPPGIGTGVNTECRIATYPVTLRTDGTILLAVEPRELAQA